MDSSSTILYWYLDWLVFASHQEFQVEHTFGKVNYYVKLVKLLTLQIYFLSNRG